MRIGILSDTHGLLRPEAVTALQASDLILHAGDVGNIEILEQLQTIAPLTAIRGNIDQYGACADLPATEVIECSGKTLYMLHSLEDLDLKPETAGFAAVIYGHSHMPKIEHRNGVLYLNPGSAGPRRFQLPVTLAYLDITPSEMVPSLKHLL